MMTAMEAPCAARRQKAAAVATGRAVHVLLVAGNAGDAGAVQTLLSRPEYGTFEVTLVTSLDEVPGAVGLCQPDAVLVDMGITGENDPSVLTRMRTLVQNIAIPIIAMTGQDNDLPTLRSRHPEAEDFLIKGVLDQGALPRVIRNVLERQTLMANLHRIILHNPDGIVVVDSEGFVLFANPAASHLFARPISDLLDEQFGFPVIGSETVEVDIAGQRVAEMRVVEIDWLNQPAYLTSLRDITEHKQAQRRLQEAQALADQANHSKSDFLAYMSHELRTPLTSVLGFSEMIETEVLGPVGTPEYRDYAEAIRVSGKHLLQIINDILDLSVIEAGKLELHYDTFDISYLVASTVRVVGTTATEKGLKLVNKVPSNLPHLTADYRRVQEILLNLLANAIKFTPTEGMVTINGQIGDGALILTVTDTGICITSDDIEKIMLPFSRVGTRASRRQQGTGLGLYLSRNLAEMHGGSLTLSSEPGKGTRARLYFPPKLVEQRHTG